MTVHYTMIVDCHIFGLEDTVRTIALAVRQHGFVGTLINGHTRGRYLDDPFFWPILERAEALGVPIYLHPTPPPQPVVEA
jgi:predicted TIM-barrel fold metal-dependent hydrolase